MPRSRLRKVPKICKGRLTKSAREACLRSGVWYFGLSDVPERACQHGTVWVEVALALGTGLMLSKASLRGL